jgi:hypothetical protein
MGSADAVVLNQTGDINARFNSTRHLSFNMQIGA